MPVDDSSGFGRWLGGALPGNVQNVARIGFGEGWKNGCEVRDRNVQRAGDDDRRRLGRLCATPAGHAGRRAIAIVFVRQREREAGFPDDQPGHTCGAERQDADQKGKCQTPHGKILQDRSAGHYSTRMVPRNVSFVRFR
jgi:hypothetical protein